MKNIGTMVVLSSVGIVQLIGCNQDPTDTSAVLQDTKPMERTHTSSDVGEKQLRAHMVIQRLHENVHLDLSTHANDQEERVLEIERKVLYPLEKDLLDRTVETLRTKTASDAQISVFATPENQPFRNDTGIQEYIVRSSLVGKEAGQLHWQEVLEQYRHVLHASVDIHKINEIKNDAVSMEVFIDIRGERRDGALQQERGWTTITFQKLDSVWTITSFKMPQKEILRRSHPLFEDVTESSGLSSVPLYSRLEALRRGGYAISVGDLNGDQHPDVYVGGWGESRVYQNDGNGTFTDVTEKTGLSLYNDSVVDRVKAAAISDLDNDGDQDMILSRFIDDSTEDVLVYRNDGAGHFSPITNAVQKNADFDRAMPLTVADFNKDGHNDLYVGFPGARDFTYLDSDPNPLQTQGLFLNNGDGTFVDQSEKFGLHNSSSKAYPHAAVKADFNGDGDIDLLIADDRRGVSQIYQNSDNKGFVPVAAGSGVENRAWAMGIAVGDYDNDGLPDLYYSNIDFLAAKRMDTFLAGELDSELYVGNRLYKNMGDGTFQNVTEQAGVGWAGEAAAGADWFDFDNDGDLDLFVLNGLWTGPGDQDLSSLFVRAYASELLLEQNNDSKLKEKLSSDAISLRNPGFNNMIIQSLMHYNGDISKPDEMANPEQTLPTLQLGGNQRNVLFRNNGDGTFTEVGFLAGLDSIDDGYMPAFADIDNDGNVDVLVRACDPGTEAYQYPSLRVFKNHQKENQSLIVTLEGNPKTSNRDAVGAKVVVTTSQGGTLTNMTREINTVSGAAQSEMAAFFGISKGHRIEGIEITWPSGKIQSVTDIEGKRLHIKESSIPTSK
jgi:hypothetical protein